MRKKCNRRNAGKETVHMIRQREPLSIEFNMCTVRDKHSLEYFAAQFFIVYMYHQKNMSRFWACVVPIKIKAKNCDGLPHQFTKAPIFFPPSASFHYFCF